MADYEIEHETPEERKERVREEQRAKSAELRQRLRAMKGGG